MKLFVSFFVLLVFSFFLQGCVTINDPRVSRFEVELSIAEQVSLAGLRLVELVESGSGVDHVNDLYVAMSEDITKEDQLFLELYFLYNTTKNLDSKVDLLVSGNSDSAMAHLIRGVYLMGKGWRARGEKYIGETSDTQLEGMAKYHGLAIKDFQFIRANSSDNFVAEIMLSEIYRSKNATANLAKKHFDNAIKIQPASYWVWLEKIIHSQPRWGGSFNEMAIIIESIKTYVSTNPNLRILENSVLKEKAYTAELNGQYSIAKGMYEQALHYGNDHGVLIGIGYLNNKLGRYDIGCPAIRKAVKKRPYNRRYNVNLLICQKLGY